MIGMNRLRAHIAPVMRWLGDQSGNVAVEFALILPPTALMLAGLIEFGMAVNTSTSLENGARAGAQYALEQGLDLDGIDATVLGAANLDVVADDIDAEEFYECSDSWGTAVAVDTDCGDGVPLATFIEVTVTDAYTPFFPFLSSLTPSQLSGSAVVRVP